MALRVSSCLLILLFALAGSVRAEEAGTPAPLPERAEEARPVAAADGAPTRATDVERAEALAEQAYREYTRGDYHAAIGLYLQAYEVTPSGDMLYNVARIYDVKLAERVRASDFYRRYTTEIDAEPARVRMANERLRALHALRVGAEPIERREQPAPRSPLGGRMISGITLLAAGTGALALGVGAGIVAMRDADFVKASCEGNRCRSERAVTAADEANRAALLSTVGWAAGGALAATGALLLTLGSRQRKRHRDGLAFSLRMSGGPGGVLTGRW